MNGNFCVIPLLQSELEDTVKFLQECIVKGLEGKFHFLNIKGVTILSQYIMGFYTRVKVEPYSEKAIKILEKIQKESGGGDEWKEE